MPTSESGLTVSSQNVVGSDSNIDSMRSGAQWPILIAVFCQTFRAVVIRTLKLYNCCNPGARGSLIVTDGSQPPGLLCGISEWARDCWQLQLMYSNDGLIKNVNEQLGLGVLKWRRLSVPADQVQFAYI